MVARFNDDGDCLAECHALHRIIKRHPSSDSNRDEGCDGDVEGDVYAKRESRFVDALHDSDASTYPNGLAFSQRIDGIRANDPDDHCNTNAIACALGYGGKPVAEYPAQPVEDAVSVAIEVHVIFDHVADGYHCGPDPNTV